MEPVVDLQYCPFRNGPGADSAFAWFRAHDRAVRDFVPDMDASTERLPDVSVELGHPIASNRYSAVFGVKSRADLVIKYQVNCDSLSTAHPLLREYHFMSRMNLVDAQGVPHVHFVSAPAPLPPAPTLKASFKLEPAEWAACRGKGGEVRFMVMERTMNSVAQISKAFPKQRVPLPMALFFTISTIEALRTIHSVGFVHNDIHAGNIVLGQHHMRIIDFGRAFRVQEVAVFVREPMARAMIHNSPWEIAGMLPGFRDDVFRALLVMAIMAGGAEAFGFHDALSESPQKAYELKATGDIFVGLDGLAPAVRDRLGAAVAAARAPATPSAAVDYDRIIEELQAALVLLRH